MIILFILITKCTHEQFGKLTDTCDQTSCSRLGFSTTSNLYSNNEFNFAPPAYGGGNGNNSSTNFTIKYNTRKDINTGTKDSIGLGLSDLSGFNNSIDLGKSALTNIVDSDANPSNQSGSFTYSQLLSKAYNQPTGMYGRTGYTEYLGGEEQGGTDTSGNLGAGQLKSSVNFNRSMSSSLYDGTSNGNFRDELTGMFGSLTSSDGKTISASPTISRAKGAGASGGTSELVNTNNMSNAAKMKLDAVAKNDLNIKTQNDAVNAFTHGQSNLAKMFQADNMTHRHLANLNSNLLNSGASLANAYQYAQGRLANINSNLHNSNTHLANDPFTKAYQNGVSDGQYAGIVGSDVRGFNGGHSYFGRHSDNYHNLLSKSITDAYGSLKDGYKGYLIGRRYRGVSHGGLDGRGGHGAIQGVSNAAGKYVGTLNGGLDGRVGYGKWVGGFLTDGKYIGDKNYGLGRSYGYGQWVGDSISGGKYAISFHGRKNDHITPGILGGSLSSAGIFGGNQYGFGGGTLSSTGILAGNQYGSGAGAFSSGGIFGTTHSGYGALSGINGNISHQFGKLRGQFAGTSTRYNQRGGYNGIMVRQNL